MAVDGGDIPNEVQRLCPKVVTTAKIEQGCPL